MLKKSPFRISLFSLFLPLTALTKQDGTGNNQQGTDSTSLTAAQDAGIATGAVGAALLAGGVGIAVKKGQKKLAEVEQDQRYQDIYAIAERRKVSRPSQQEMVTLAIQAVSTQDPQKKEKILEKINELTNNSVGLGREEFIAHRKLEMELVIAVNMQVPLGTKEKMMRAITPERPRVK